MAHPVMMPKQGQSVESCILTQWYISVGDPVKEGDLLFAYETDKAAFEEEARADGILLAQFFEAGEEVPVLTNLAVIGQEGEAVDQFRPPSSPSDAEGRKNSGAEEAFAEADRENRGDPEIPDGAGTDADQAGEKTGTGREATDGKAAVSPRARRMAEEQRVVVRGISGSGPGGRIIEKDILGEIHKGKRLTPLAKKKFDAEGFRLPDAGSKPYGKISKKELLEETGSSIAAGPAVDFTDEPLSKVRQIIAGAMYRSLQNSAQLTHHLGANATAMLQIRKEIKARLARGYAHHITINDMVCFAVIRALKLHPGANAHYREGIIRKFHKVNLGIAVDTERGLLVPVLVGADDLSLAGLSARLKELAEAARLGKVNPDLLVPEAASFTVSNLGSYGVEMFTPVINLPQVGILGVNSIVQRPSVLADGTFGFLPFIGLSLTYDHRALDGGPATLFLAEIRNQIETLSPNLLDP